MVKPRDLSDSEDQNMAKRARLEVVESSSSDSPVEESTSEESPSEENASEDSPIESPSEEKVSEESSLEESPLEEKASEESSLEESSLEENASEYSPVEKSTSEESPLDDKTSEANPLEKISSEHSAYYPNAGEDECPSSWLDEDTDYVILQEHTIRRVRLPNREKDKDVRLECDDSDYISHHRIVTVYPCATFDVIPDQLGDNRADQYPLTMTAVGGTHRISCHRNNLFVLKLSNMHKNGEEDGNKENEGNKGNGEESESDSEDESFKPFKPHVECAAIRHPGEVNRVKVAILGDVTYAATWSARLENVYIWDLTEALAAVNDPDLIKAYKLKNKHDDPESPPPYSEEFTFTGHSVEGFALEWSPIIPGMLASGDRNGSIYVWKPLEGGSWHIDQRPYTAHTKSVMDIKWSPKESNVMVTCSYDKSIGVWDIRAAPDNACMLRKHKAHDKAVAGICWNPNDPSLLSGGNDGLLKIWDLRKFSEGNAVSSFKYHNACITSVDWHPTNRSVFAASGEDDQVTLWNIERNKNLETDDLDFPPQLLFTHKEQRVIGELHWHKQMPGVLLSIAENGLNVIRTFKI